MGWCDEVAEKLNNSSIDTSTIFSGALIPELVQQRPDSIPYLIEWPIELDLVNDDCVIVIRNNVEYNIYELELKLTNNSAEGPIEFSVGNESFAVNYQLVFIDGKAVVELVSPLDLAIKKGKQSLPLCEFFNSEFPTIKFTDQSLLEGNILVKIPKVRPSFNEENIIVWDWENTDIHKESQGLSKETERN